VSNADNPWVNGKLREAFLGLKPNHKIVFRKDARIYKRLGIVWQIFDGQRLLAVTEEYAGKSAKTLISAGKVHSQQKGIEKAVKKCQKHLKIEVSPL